MKTKRAFSIWAFGLIICVSQAAAQPAAFRRSKTLSLELLVAAHIRPNDPQRVVFTVDSFDVQRQTIVQRESRIRLDTADGKRLLLRYPKARSSVVIPDEPVQVESTGKKQVTVAAKEIRFYTLKGDPVSMEQVAELLAEPRPVFLLESTAQDPPKVPDVIRIAFKSDCLIAITRKRVRETRTIELPDSVPKPQPPPPE